MVALSKNWREGGWNYNLYALLMGRACHHARGSQAEIGLALISNHDDIHIKVE
jgi:hypothetical protein